MTRDISSANIAASQAETIHPVLFVELLFDGGPVRMHSELGTITWGGNDFSGLGTFGGITPADEQSELARTPITLTLSGVPATDPDANSVILAALLNEHYQGRTATVYQGYLNTETRALVDDPFILYRGRMDTPSFEQGETLTVQLTVESRFAAWDRPQERRYNNADQTSRYPGDRGLEFVEQVVERQITWGIPSPGGAVAAPKPRSFFG